MVEYTFNYDHNNDRHDNVESRSKSYHVDGVTVGIWRIKNEEFYNDADRKEEILRHATRVKLVSNDGDSLNNLVEIILDRFPSFEEIDFDSMR